MPVYKEFFKTSLSEVLSFRINFILQVVMNLLFMGTSYFTAQFIFNHIENIGVWNETQFFFFLSFVFTVDQIHYTLFSANFWEFSEDVRLGNLDFHLLKPVSSLFIILTRHIAVPGLVTAFINFCLMIYFGWKSELSLLSWFLLPFAIFASLSLLLAIEVLISLFNFLTVQGMGINQARIQLQHFLRWPDFIYKNPLRLWLIPFLIITSLPVRFLLDSYYWPKFLFMILGTLILWKAIFWLWPKFLSFYESPSS